MYAAYKYIIIAICINYVDFIVADCNYMLDGMISHSNTVYYWIITCTRIAIHTKDIDFMLLLYTGPCGEAKGFRTNR